MLEPPLHTATRLGMGHRPVAGGREAPGAAAQPPAAGNQGRRDRHYPAYGPLLTCLTRAIVREPGGDV